MKISYLEDWRDFNDLPFEIVERKGLGHPDTLADGLAEAVSLEYSNYCLEKFGVVPHHNLDKLYIGAGLFSVDYGKNEMDKPAVVRINGRISNRFGKEEININEIQAKAIKNYLSNVLPRAVIGENITIDHNSTQNTRRKNWFSPQSREDLPELQNLTANDTSVCVAHAPLSASEEICLLVEKYFWKLDKLGQAVSPKYEDIGQDIKVMVIRQGNNIRVNTCVPVFSDTISSHAEYKERVITVQSELEGLIREQNFSKKLNIFIVVNNPGNNTWHPYMLGLGSCIECGEEGVVGRGNGISGLIPTMRSKSNEAFYGKNPVYHVGRVLGLLTQRISNRIYKETGSGNSVYVLGVHSDPLLPPTNVSISLQDMAAQKDVEAIAREELSEKTYLNKVLEKVLTNNFSEKLYDRR